MQSSDPLRWPLAIAAAYTIAAGVIQILPALAEVVFDRPVLDPSVESLYGVAIASLGAVAGVLAFDRARFRPPVWMVLGSLVVTTVVIVV